MHISATQIVMARALLRISQSELAKHAGVSRPTIANLEEGKQEGHAATIQKITEYLDSCGIELLDHDGVRRKPAGTMRILNGHDGFYEFITDVYSTVKHDGGHICVTNADERQFERWQGAHAENYINSMGTVKNLTFQILIKEGDSYYTASKYAKYRHVPSIYFGAVPCYVYGDKVAQILFTDNDVTVYLFENKPLADAQRKQFEILWENAIK